MTPNESIIDPERALVVTKPLVVADGLHTGTIVRLEYRDEPYKYMDVFVKPDEVDVELKVSYPQNVTPNSSAGKLLERFGAKLNEGSSIIPYEILVGKKCQFLTSTESVKMKDGHTVNIARVLFETLKPAAIN